MYKILGGRYVVDAMGVIRSNQTGSLMQTVTRAGKYGYMLVTRTGWGADFYSKDTTKTMYDIEHAKVAKVESIRKDTYIVGSKTKAGGVSFSETPKVHLLVDSAKTEAARLAGITVGTTFVVAKIVGEVTAGGVTWN